MTPLCPVIDRVGRALLAGLLLAGGLAPAARAATYDCMIHPKEMVDVRSAVDGVVRRIMVDRGDRVRQGQVLAQLAAGPEQASVEMAKYRAQADAAVKAAEARHDLAKRRMDRSEDLYKQNFISSQARDDAAAEYRLAQAQLNQALEDRRMAQLDESRAVEVLKQRTVLAPVSGVIVERTLSPGELVTVDSRDPILRLAVLDPLYVELVMPVAEFGAIRRGMQAEITPELKVGDGKWIATVSIVDRVVDAPSGTFGVRLELPNRDYALPSGIKCKARILDR
jgi:RND family efflux transporter MFP subunit